MPTSDLGKKLKEARLAKKMTQSEVVGNFITRNMLSQIESGAAMPSVKTLAYLAGVLDLPLSELMGGEHSSLDDFQTLEDAKERFRAGDFNAVLELCHSMPDAISDELYALGARACLAQAVFCARKNVLADVTSLMRRGMDYAGRGLYACDSLGRRVRAAAAQPAGRAPQPVLPVPDADRPAADRSAQGAGNRLKAGKPPTHSRGLSLTRNKEQKR